MKRSPYAEEIHSLWSVAHQKLPLDELWLQRLLHQQTPTPVDFEHERARSADRVSVPQASEVPHIDWVGALDVSHFAGREVEVAELSQWLLEERCRFIAILGMGGIGKSMLASYLRSRLAPQIGGCAVALGA